MKIGTKIEWEYDDGSPLLGTVIQNLKMPDDICIAWENGAWCSYDKDVVEEKMTVKPNNEN